MKIAEAMSGLAGFTTTSRVAGEITRSVSSSGIAPTIGAVVERANAQSTRV